MHGCSIHSTDAMSNATNSNPVCYMGVSLWPWRHYPILGVLGHTRHTLYYVTQRHWHRLLQAAYSLLASCTFHTNNIQNNIQYIVLRLKYIFYYTNSLILVFGWYWTIWTILILNNPPAVSTVDAVTELVELALILNRRRPEDDCSVSPVF